MYIYKVRENGINCSTMYRREGDFEPGWDVIPKELEGRRLYMVDGELTNEEPQVLIDKEAAELAAELKIQSKMRELAVVELKKVGDLPAEFVDKRG